MGLSRVSWTALLYPRHWSYFWGEGGSRLAEVTGKGQDQLSSAQITGASSSVAPVVTQATDIKHRPCYGRAMDPDMDLGSSLGLAVSIAVQGTQISMSPLVAWPTDFNMASGVGSDHRYLYALQW